MTTEHEILHALEGLPPTAVRQVKDFIAFLKEQQATKSPPRSPKLLARKQVTAIKKWAGAQLRQGFSGRDHDTILYGSKP